ncbi:MAG: molybdate ABC transporter substrate-binding protein [Cyanobacteria bacterium J06638_20]
MNRRHFAALSALTLSGCLAIASCSQAPTPTTTTDEASAIAAESVNLTISVAASVQDAMNDIQTAYQDEAPNVTITYNFGSSGSLAQQIAQGAPTDVFLSASIQWMDDLEGDGHILGDSRRDLLQNDMVLIAPQDDAEISDFDSLTLDPVSRVAIGEPESVPAGRYAKEVLTSMEIFDGLESKLVFTSNVRQVLSYVETGNVDAGVVYATDAMLSEQVRVVATAPADTHSPIVYPIAVVQDSDNAEAAQVFVDFLSTDKAIAIFEAYGFTLAD